MLTLDISNGLHSHTVTLTVAQVMQIAAGGRVSVESSTDTHSDGGNPHNHTVTFNQGPTQERVYISRAGLTV